MTNTEPTKSPAGFVVWRRQSRKEPWQMADLARTEAEAVNLLKGAGDFVILPAGIDPNRKPQTVG
jgi:hypothetical protein